MFNLTKFNNTEAHCCQLITKTDETDETKTSSTCGLYDGEVKLVSKSETKEKNKVVKITEPIDTRKDKETIDVEAYKRTGTKFPKCIKVDPNCYNYTEKGMFKTIDRELWPKPLKDAVKLYNQHYESCKDESNDENKYDKSEDIKNHARQIWYNFSQFCHQWGKHGTFVC